MSTQDLPVDQDASLADGPAGRLVVGVDGSAGSLAALQWALAEAQLRGAGLHLVMAWRHPASYGGSSVWTMMMDRVGTNRQTMADAARTEIARIGKDAGKESDTGTWQRTKCSYCLGGYRRAPRGGAAQGGRGCRCPGAGPTWPWRISWCAVGFSEPADPGPCPLPRCPGTWVEPGKGGRTGGPFRSSRRPDRGWGRRIRRVQGGAEMGRYGGADVRLLGGCAHCVGAD